MKKILVVGTLAVALIGGTGSSQATPGFYVTLSDGTNTQNVFFATTSGGSTTFDGYSLNYSFGTNYPGTAAFATLSTQITLSSSASGTLTPFSSRTQVTDSSAQSTPILFTGPVGSALELTASTSVSSNPQLTSLSLIGSATANATTATDPTIGPNQASTKVVPFSALAGFTLQNDLNNISISANTGGLSNEVIQTTAFVDFIPAPEPASLALVGSGLLGLGMIRRRKA